MNLFQIDELGAILCRWIEKLQLAQTNVKTPSVLINNNQAVNECI